VSRVGIVAVHARRNYNQNCPIARGLDVLGAPITGIKKRGDVDIGSGLVLEPGMCSLNFATSQAILVEAVSRMGRALANFLAERTRLAHTGSSSSVPRPRLRKPSAGFLMPSKNGSELDSNFSFNHSRPNELRSGTITGVTSDVARSI
jgi:hypothetical protein